MTGIAKQIVPTAESGASSSLPFDPASLAQGIRVRPAQFARMCGVSKQAVSGWIKDGKITLYLDGTLDPTRAARDVINKSDPGRLRAKLFRQAVDDVTGLRRRITELEATNRDLQARIEVLEHCAVESERTEELYRALLLDHEDDLRSAADSEAFAALLNALLDEAVVEAAGRTDPDGLDTADNERF